MDVYQRRRLVALSSVVGVFVIVVLAVASGGDDDAPQVTGSVTGATGEEGPQSLGKRDYIRQADRICAEAASSLQNIDATDTIQAAQREARIMSGQLRSLQQLPPPNRDRRLANTYLRELGTQVEALQQRRTALERADDAALIEIDGTLATAEDAAQAAATEFGFETCGNPEAIVDETQTEPVPVDPGAAEPAPVDPGAAEPAPVEPPPEDSGGTDPDTGGVAPDDSGGVSP